MHTSKPRERITQFHSTAYYNFSQTKGPRRNLVVYSDKMSKVLPDAFCTHIEMRIVGAKNLTAANIRYDTDLLKLDHQAFWKQQIKLVDTPSAEVLGTVWRRHFEKNGRRGTRQFPFGSREKSVRRVGHLCERMAAIDDSGYFTATDLQYLLSSLRILGPTLPATLFRDAGIDLILPEPGNALWEAQAERDPVLSESIT